MDSSGSAVLQENISYMQIPIGKIIMGRPPVYSQAFRLSCSPIDFYINEPGACCLLGLLAFSPRAPIDQLDISAGVLAATAFRSLTAVVSAPGCMSRNEGASLTSGHLLLAELLYRSI